MDAFPAPFGAVRPFGQIMLQALTMGSSASPSAAMISAMHGYFPQRVVLKPADDDPPNSPRKLPLCLREAPVALHKILSKSWA